MEQNNISNRIRELREERGLTQLDLANVLYVKQQSVAQWEKGERDLKSGMIIQIAKYFGVTTDYLLGISDYKTRQSSDIGSVIGLSEQAISNLTFIKNKKYMGLDLIEHILSSYTLIDNWIELMMFLSPTETDIRKVITTYINETAAVYGEVFSRESLNDWLMNFKFNVSKQDFEVLYNFVQSYLKLCSIAEDDMIEGISLTSSKDMGQILYNIEKSFKTMVDNYVEEKLRTV